jgi:hypothetical protein
MRNVPQGKIRQSVKNAPFQIGEFIKVVYATDETFNHRFMGRIGIIVHYDYSCGCGQSYPKDPMIGVQFANGKKEEFWAEEIVPLREYLNSYDYAFDE